MNKATTLARLNARMLAAYSERTTSALRNVLPLRMALPHVEPVIACNVEKEIRKDTLIISHAAAALRSGTRPGKDALRDLFLKTRAIDDFFLREVHAFPLQVVIRYDEIEPLRVRRIRCLLESNCRILHAWQTEGGLRAGLRAAFTERELESLLREDLELYAREVRALSHSVRLPALLAPLRTRLSQQILETMSGVGTRLARDITRGIYEARTRAIPIERHRATSAMSVA
jgi:hypothetical protein